MPRATALCFVGRVSSAERCVTRRFQFRGGPCPDGQLTVREFERWLTQDAGFSRTQARALMRDGYKGLDSLRDAGRGATWEKRLAGQIAEATRLLQTSLSPNRITR